MGSQILIYNRFISAGPELPNFAISRGSEPLNVTLMTPFNRIGGYTQLSLGPYDDDLNFKYGENTEVKQSCATTLNGEMYIFSGSSYKNNKLSDNYKQVNITKSLKIF